jgi:hypothetical protein
MIVRPRSITTPLVSWLEVAALPGSRWLKVSQIEEDLVITRHDGSEPVEGERRRIEETLAAHEAEPLKFPPAHLTPW